MEYVFDNPIWSDKTKVLTAERLCVPGLEMFGHNCAAGNLRLLGPHIHKTAEFLYLANGTQPYNANGQEYTLRGNQVLVVGAEVLHSSGDTPFGRHESLWFRLDLKAFVDSLGLPSSEKEPILLRLSQPAVSLIPLRENLYPELQTAFYCLASPEPAQRLRGYVLFVNFIIQLTLQAEPEPLYSPGIQKALTHIEENICTHLKLEALAALSGLSLSGFKQKFRRETGITPREYVNLMKIKKAKEFLREGRSVTDTAFALDFSSSSYFSVLFRQVEDISPREYAQQHRKNTE